MTKRAKCPKCGAEEKHIGGERCEMYFNFLLTKDPLEKTYSGYNDNVLKQSARTICTECLRDFLFANIPVMDPIEEEDLD